MGTKSSKENQWGKINKAKSVQKKKKQIWQNFGKFREKKYKAQINEGRTEQRLNNESLLLEKDYKGLLWTIVVRTPDYL